MATLKNPITERYVAGNKDPWQSPGNPVRIRVRSFKFWPNTRPKIRVRLPETSQQGISGSEIDGIGWGGRGGSEGP